MGLNAVQDLFADDNGTLFRGSIENGADRCCAEYCRDALDPDAGFGGERYAIFFAIERGEKRRSEQRKCCT